MTTILSLAIEPAAQARFDALREAHYPPKLNQIAAHLTLFHTLPNTKAVREVLLAGAARRDAFAVQVTGVMSMGRGVALQCAAPELTALHGELAAAFAGELTAQDRQGFRPHVVVQNKVSAEAARGLFAALSAEFVRWEFAAVGLRWWDYLGGPWGLREGFGFRATSG